MNKRYFTNLLHVSYLFNTLSGRSDFAHLSDRYSRSTVSRSRGRAIYRPGNFGYNDIIINPYSATPEETKGVQVPSVNFITNPGVLFRSGGLGSDVDEPTFARIAIMSTSLDKTTLWYTTVYQWRVILLTESNIRSSVS